MPSNATRFISAYNKIDKQLRALTNLKTGVSFNEAVRKGAVYSSVVRKYEDDLLDYARLRNAIVHGSDDRMTIAEPHTDVTDKIERIAELLASPPLASRAARKAMTLKYDTPLWKTVKTMTTSGYSNVPVVKNGCIVGVVTNKLIVEFIARLSSASAVGDALETATADSVLSGGGEHYEILSCSATADSVLDLFSKRPKLQIVILTSDATPKGEIRGVLTTGDIIKLNELLY